MNAQQAQFVAGVVSGLTLKDAYVQAGYKARDHSAESAAERLARDPAVAAAIAAGLAAAEAEAIEAAKLTKEWVIDKLMTLALAADKDVARIQALELLGNHLGMWVEQKKDLTPPTPPLDVSKLPDDLRKKLLDHLRAARIAESGAARKSAAGS